MMLSILIDNRYDVDMQRFYHLEKTNRGGILFVLPKGNSETLRRDFDIEHPLELNYLRSLSTLQIQHLGEHT